MDQSTNTKLGLWRRATLKGQGQIIMRLYALIVRFSSIHLILALVVHLDLELFQIEVKTIFLNGELAEEIYMDQVEGFVLEDQEDKVCHLKLSIYGLKQSSRSYISDFMNPSPLSIYPWQKKTTMYMLRRLLFFPIC